MPSLQRMTLRQIVPLIFLPAGVGLLFQITLSSSAAQTILAIALTIFCPELARMAWIDLKNIEVLTASASPALEKQVMQTAATQQEKPTSSTNSFLQAQQIKQFHTVIVSTIALEATGFYLSLYSLPAGAIVIILSQLWFNSLASVQLYPGRSLPVVRCSAKDRKAVLILNALTAGLLCFWPVTSAQLGLSIALLVLVALYLAVKYLLLQPEETKANRCE